MIESTVAQLQGELSLERLAVIDHRLRFDRYLPPLASDHRVPRPEIADDREGHFRPEGEPGAEAYPKALEKPCVARVANRIATREGPDHHVEADHVSDARDGVQRRRLKCASLDSIHLGPREAARPGDILHAQTGAPSRRPQLPAEAPARGGGGPSGAVSRRLPGRHRRPVSRATLIRPLADRLPPSERYVDRLPRRRPSSDALPVGRTNCRRRPRPADVLRGGRDET
jgi:hypothetical protein